MELKDPEFVELISYVLGSNNEGIKIVIPKFQRMKPSKWDDVMKSKLIDSIQKNWSISSITLWGSSDMKEKEFILLNGLQRLNTLLEYYNNPFTFTIITDKIKEILQRQENFDIANFEWFNEWFIEEIFGNYNNIIENQFNEDDNMTILKHLMLKWFPYINKEERIEMKKRIKLISKEVNEYIKFPNGYKFSIITCKCKESELCELFSRMNTSSVNLEEHEIFAATWSGKPKIKLNDELRESLREYYNSFANDKNYKLEMKKEEHEKEEYNVYEFIMALFYNLRKKYPALCKNLQDNVNPEIMFKVVSICALGEIKYEVLPDNIYHKYLNGDLEIFCEILIKSLDFIKNIHGNFSKKKIDNKYLIMLGTYFFNANTIDNNKEICEDLIRLNYLYYLSKKPPITNEVIKRDIHNKTFLEKINKKILKDSIIKYNSKNGGFSTSPFNKYILYLMFTKDKRINKFNIHCLIDIRICKEFGVGSYCLGNLSIYNMETNRRNFKNKEEIICVMSKQELKTINQLLKFYSKYLV